MDVILTENVKGLGTIGEVVKVKPGYGRADALAEKGIEIDRRKILLDQPIKTLGEHDIEIKLNAGVNATIKVNVLSEEASNAAAEKAEPAAPVAEAETAEEPVVEDK
ncbi:MAG: 50S ribosomal L9 C-terminal domain-containing protein [Desulfuromonadales bacterium]